MNGIQIACALALAGASLAACAADASSVSPEARRIAASDPQRAACGPWRLGFLERRIVEKADQGAAALRQYVWITRSLYGLDMQESLAFAERYRAERADCERRAAV